MNQILSLVGSLAVGLSAQAATPYSDWQHSGTFYIITTPEGADLPASATENNFPLLVRLNSGNFNFGEAQPDGSKANEALSYMTLSGSGQVIFHLYGADPRSSTRVSLHEWHHVALSVAGNNPDFTVNAPATWDGCTPITISAKVANLEQMRAKGAGELHYSWNVAGLATVTQIANDSLTLKLKQAHLSGPLTITLSIHNGGAPTIRSAIIKVTDPSTRASVPAVLKADVFKHYIDKFNADDKELYANSPNALAWQFIEKNAPLFECPDKAIEQTYYFRWWTYRKHIKLTPDGLIVDEFLPQVGWAGKYNSISCAAGHHLYEGRWLRDPKVLDDYSGFWFRKDGGDPRRYSFWAADAIWARYRVSGNKSLTIGLLPDLMANYEAWEKSHRDANGLYWQIDDRDGMEASIGGSGYRATINSYQFGDALAIAQIAELAGKVDIAGEYRAKAAAIKELVQAQLWDADAQFFKVLPRGETKAFANVRELHGFTPWYFNLPGPQFAVAWKQVMDPQGFYAPFGPTTAEQRHPKFALNYTGHECQWNGPSWPYATSITLTGLANLLNGPPQQVIGAKDYFKLLKIYAQSHQLKLDDGRVVPWIDENLNPSTGDWISRTRLKTWQNGTWDAGKGGEERGKDYNHSTYGDLVITGLVGLRPRADETVEVNPLVPDGMWDWFCLDHVLYHGRILTILWDKTGAKYGKGKGLRVLVGNQEIARSETLTRITGPLPH